MKNFPFCFQLKKYFCFVLLKTLMFKNIFKKVLETSKCPSCLAKHYDSKTKLEM